jgi:ABC-type nickel/cobalt efflux system permease component RcnA
MSSRRLLRFWLFALMLLPLRVCFAHPMGNFSVNHYTRITLEKDGIQLQYYIDLAEIPTYQELQQNDLTPTDAAGIAKYLVTHGADLQRGLTLRINGAPLPLHIVSRGVIFPPGAGGLPTMKVGYIFRAAYPAHAGSAAANLDYTDANYPGHAGWREIIMTGAPGLLLASSVPATDRSAGLSNYPTDMLNSPPQDLSVTARLELPVMPVVAAAEARAAAAPVAAAGPATAAARATAVLPRHGSETAVANAASAPGAGLHPQERPVAAKKHLPVPITHALPVVHTAVAADAVAPMQLQANRQGTSHSAFTQLVTTRRLSLWFLFTAAFISMGLGALHALEPGHGKTIVAAYLVGSRGTARHAALLGVIVTVAHTASVFALGAITLYASHYILPEQLYPWLGVLSGLTIAGLGAYMLLRRLTGVELEHEHVVGEMHGHWFSSKKKPAEEIAAAREAEESGPGKTVSLTQLFTLGITGGIIPCPAALVVLLSAFALHRVGFGFFLITSFSVGLATVLIGFGLLMVYARRFMARLQVDGPITRRWLPVASAGFMTILGAAIAVRAFFTTGITMHSFSQQKLGPALFIAGLGLILGIRHSTDTDHVVAISTIVTKQRSIRGAALIGTLWGLGHTLTIFIVGCLIILGGVVIPTRIGLSMEFSVGLMLILLGVLNLTGVMQTILNRLSPQGRTPAEALHTPGEPLRANFDPAPAMPAERRGGRLRGTFRDYGAYQCLRPLAIGLVHGLAGSAAVALLVLSSIHNPLWAIGYLVIFGAGTMLGMMCMTAAMSLPLVYAGDKLPKMGRYLTVASGIVSVCFGTFLVYHLGFVGGLFTSHPHWTPQ